MDNEKPKKRKYTPAKKNEINTKIVTKVVGRPPFPWTDELEIEIANYIATHAVGLKEAALNNKHWPEVNCIFERIHKSPKFGDMYLAAKQQQVFVMNEETLNIMVETKNNPELVPWAREAIKQYNWQAARLKPRTFGDKTYTEVNVLKHEDTLDVLK